MTTRSSWPRDCARPSTRQQASRTDQYEATLRGVMKITCRAVMIAILMVGVMPVLASAQGETSPLQLEAKIPLGSVSGRIDHMAIDLARQRLFVAELENNSVGIVDLRVRTVVGRITGLREPQGLAYAPHMDSLHVANAGDGSVQFFRGIDYASVGQIDLGGDADNIRLDDTANQLVIGYGDGGLAILDLASSKKVADIR